ncbi:5-formyltetrahydrofolate cyclo-ligase [Devosia pacifica]|uniref:5-formyltetrahydrofolate cyclo-ligase n=1 Tax=Devosia pacifica TaxID=1335967 RepID=A0A918VMU7_9HYPH|nr:5-formyltetrahydrofolate cyclo-ligase [Devosia pacifica]GHA10119.1 5-formyltetrahydrofolate cyclo-ligase [Devosia pacifica]
MSKRGNWDGRSPEKDTLRNRIWSMLEDSGYAMGETWSHIPNFVGADIAAWRLAQTPAWMNATTIKVNPDPAQYQIRLRALYEGKTLFCPVPALTQSYPYLRIDAATLQAKGVSFELAATHQGYFEHGTRIEFAEVPPLDFCVVGSVAVSRIGGRTGKGAGFADIETGIFRELGTIGPQTPIATTIHSTQLVEADEIVMMDHDSPLDFIATEAELIETHSANPRPKGIMWDAIQPDQFEAIPFLRELQRRSQ